MADPTPKYGTYSTIDRDGTQRVYPINSYEDYIKSRTANASYSLLDADPAGTDNSFNAFNKLAGTNPTLQKAISSPVGAKNEWNEKTWFALQQAAGEEYQPAAKFVGNKALRTTGDFAKLYGEEKGYAEAAQYGLASLKDLVSKFGKEKGLEIAPLAERDDVDEFVAAFGRDAGLKEAKAAGMLYSPDQLKGIVSEAEERQYAKDLKLLPQITRKYTETWNPDTNQRDVKVDPIYDYDDFIKYYGEKNGRIEARTYGVTKDGVSDWTYKVRPTRADYEKAKYDIEYEDASPERKKELDRIHIESQISAQRYLLGTKGINWVTPIDIDPSDITKMMADQLVKSGVKDIRDVQRAPDGSIINVRTGQPLAADYAFADAASGGRTWSGTFAGDGSTRFNVDFVNGIPVFTAQQQATQKSGLEKLAPAALGVGLTALLGPAGALGANALSLPLAAAIGGGFAGLAATGDIETALKSAAMGYVGASIAPVVADTTGFAIGSAANQAISSGIASALKGESLENIALSAATGGVAAGASSFIKELGSDLPNVITNAATSAATAAITGRDVESAVVSSLVKSGFDALRTPSVSDTYPEEFERGSAKDVLQAQQDLDNILYQEQAGADVAEAQKNLEEILYQEQVGADVAEAQEKTGGTPEVQYQEQIAQDLATTQQQQPAAPTAPPAISPEEFNDMTPEERSKYILQMAVKKAPEDLRFDANGDGRITSADALQVRKGFNPFEGPTAELPPRDVIPEVVAPGGEATTELAPVELTPAESTSGDQLLEDIISAPPYVEPVVEPPEAPADLERPVIPEVVAPGGEATTEPLPLTLDEGPVAEEIRYGEEPPEQVLVAEPDLLEPEAPPEEVVLAPQEPPAFTPPAPEEEIPLDELLLEGGADLEEDLGLTDELLLGGGDSEDLSTDELLDLLAPIIGEPDDTTGMSDIEQLIREGETGAPSTGNQGLIDYEETAGKELAEAQERTGGGEEALYQEEAGKELAEAEQRTGGGEEALYQEEADKDLAEAQQEFLDSGEVLGDLTGGAAPSPAPAPAPTPAPAPAPAPTPAPAPAPAPVTPAGTDLFSLLSMLGLLGGMGQQPTAQAPAYQYADIGEITPFEELFTPYSDTPYTPQQTQRRG